MKDKILAYLKEREIINNELTKIMGYCDDSPIYDELDKRWCVTADDFRIEVDGETSLEDDYYGYTISSLSAKGEKLFMGELDGVVYIMAYSENWRETEIFMLSKDKQVFLEDE